MEKPPELAERPEATEAEEATRKQEQTPTHNLYLCNDVSCQRILKTMLLQKFDDLKVGILCFNFSLNPLRFSLTREIDKKYQETKRWAIVNNLKTYIKIAIWYFVV